MSLDEFLPEFDFNEVHSTRVRATPAEVLAAARAVTPREVPLVVALMALRRLPAAVRGVGRGAPASGLLRDLDEPMLDSFTSGSFVVLAERPDEFAAGGVGRFWTAAGGVRRVSRAEFVTFDEPGFAKAAMNFHVRETDAGAGGGSVLVTETRILATDEAARRSFRRYWRVIRPGSAAIRRAWLRAIRLRAERAERG